MSDYFFSIAMILRQDMMKSKNPQEMQRFIWLVAALQDEDNA